MSAERKTHLLGYPIAHSLSPALHNAIYAHANLPWTHTLYESPSIAPFLPNLSAPEFAGSAVTMPFKVAIIPYLDGLTEQGRAVGSVNTIFFVDGDAEGEERAKRVSALNDGNGTCQGLWKSEGSARKGRLIGTNTDCIGVREAVLQNVSPAMLERIKAGGRTGMIVGGGGTSRAAIYAMRTWLGCEKIYFVNRDRGEVDTVIAECTAKGFGDGLMWVGTLEEVEGLEAPDVVVSCVPDFEPVTTEEVTARAVVSELLKRATAVDRALLEMCYHPSSDTRIKRLAVGHGWQVIDGTAALIWQGLEQDRIWTGKDVYALDVESIKKSTFATLH
jgi:quinate dehydrogenase